MKRKCIYPYKKSRIVLKFHFRCRCRRHCPRPSALRSCEKRQNVKYSRATHTHTHTLNGGFLVSLMPCAHTQAQRKYLIDDDSQINTRATTAIPTTVAAAAAASIADEEALCRCPYRLILVSMMNRRFVCWTHEKRNVVIVTRWGRKMVELVPCARSTIKFKR